MRAWILSGLWVWGVYYLISCSLFSLVLVVGDFFFFFLVEGVGKLVER